MSETKLPDAATLAAIRDACKGFAPPAELFTPMGLQLLKEYDEVQSLPWEDAADNVRTVQLLAISFGPIGYFAVMGCERLIKRYESGERTRELFDEMMAVH